jgi:hypothetical protein
VREQEPAGPTVDLCMAKTLVSMGHSNDLAHCGVTNNQPTQKTNLEIWMKVRS